MFTEIFTSLIGFLTITTVSGIKSGLGNAQLKSGFVPGDFIIGALFPVHEHPLVQGDDPLVCGTIRDQYGIQRVETAFYAIDLINKNKELLPGIKLGINIKDNCNSEAIALHQTISLIEDPSNDDDDDEEEGNYFDAKSNKSFVCTAKWKLKSPLIGVIGPAASSNAISVQNLLKLFQIPQIGYSTTSSDLGKINMYPYFVRVVPSDIFQTNLISTLLQKFNWTYVSVVYTDDNYGQSGMSNFQSNASEYNICIARLKAIAIDAKSSEFDSVIATLNMDENVNVIVCYCDGSTISGLLDAIEKANLAGRFTFVGSDAWGSRSRVVEKAMDAAKGSISIAIDEVPVPEFDDYFVSLNPTNNQRNPWFEEYWENRFHCKINATKKSELPICTGKESLKEEYYEPDSKIDYVIKSIYAMAHALHDMHADVCNNTHGVCDKLRHFNTSKFMDYILNVEFKYRHEVVKFDSAGEPWKVKYSIYNFQHVEDEYYQYVPVGEFQKIQNDLYLILDDNVTIQFPGSCVTKSVCSDPCQIGSAQILNKEGADKKCCWSCLPCKSDEIVYNISSCVSCYEGYWPNGDKTLCEETPVQYILLAYSLAGAILTVITIYIFIKYQETPVVKSATKELCYIMLVGMLTAHSTVIITLTEQTLVSCVLLRTMPPLSFSIIYASLFVKTNRISRILTISKKKFPNMRPRFISLSSQIIITFTLIGMQMIICGVMLVRESPTLNKDYNKVRGAVYCPLDMDVILPPFVFVAVLVFMCTLYAFKTRNLPDNFNEAKFIGFAMYVTCITWVAFALMYFGSRLKLTTVCICASTNALVVLIFLFFPKLYVIIWRPEKNTRANFTTTKSIRCIITGGQVSNAATGNQSTGLLCTRIKKSTEI